MTVIAKDQIDGVPHRDIADSVLVDDVDWSGTPALTIAANGDLLAFYEHGTTVGSANPVVVKRCPAGTDPMAFNWLGAARTTVYAPAGHTPPTGARTLANGDIVLTTTTYVGSDYTVEAHISTDHGYTWSAPITIEHGFASATSYSSAGPVFEVTPGVLLMPLYGVDDPADWVADVANRYYVRVSRSTDGGRTWADYATVIPASVGTLAEGYKGWDEAQIERTSDGNLMMMVRSEMGSPPGGVWRHIVRSTDGGATWSAPRAAFSRGSATPALIRTSEGELWTTARSPTPVHAYFVGSKDDGISWSERKPMVSVAEGANEGMWYSDWAQMDDGTLLCLNAEAVTWFAGGSLYLYSLTAPAPSANGGNPGTYSGTVTPHAGELITDSGSDSVLFGTGGLVSVPTSPSLEGLFLNGDPYSFVALVKPGSGISVADHYLIFGVWTDSPPHLTAYLEVVGGETPILRFAQNVDLNVNPATTGVAVDSTAISADTTYLAIGTYDGTNINLYVNGVLADSAACPAPILNSNYPQIVPGIGNFDNSIDLGSYPFASLPGRGAEVVTVRRGLSADEVRKLYRLLILGLPTTPAALAGDDLILI